MARISLALGSIAIFGLALVMAMPTVPSICMTPEINWQQILISVLLLSASRVLSYFSFRGAESRNLKVFVFVSEVLVFAIYLYFLKQVLGFYTPCLP